MATLNIAEFRTLGRDNRGEVAPVAFLPPNAVQNVSISATSAQSSALSANTSLVRLRSDTSCAVEIASNPTAATTSMALDANQPEYFAVQPGAALKIAVIAV